MSALEFHEATRTFGDVVALNRISLTLDGGVTALVGPNGAGKSTLMKLATAHVRPTAGRVTLFGQAPWDNPQVMRRVGLVPEQDAFYEAMPGLEFVARLAQMQGLPAAQARRAAQEELSALGLEEAAWGRPIKTYSKGMRQRAKLAQALAHQPDLLLLDEPLLGCDPVARRRIQDRILALRSQGCTVLVSSHILPEMERLTRDIAVLLGGRLVARGQSAQVRAALTQIPSRVRLHTPAPRAVAAAVTAWEDVESVRIGEAFVDVETRHLRDFLEELHARAPAAWRLQGHETLDADLDSLFLYLSGEGVAQ